jgi:hypothetical protein
MWSCRPHWGQLQIKTPTFDLDRNTVDSGDISETAGEILDSKKAHALALLLVSRRMPRGKYKTTNTKKIPMSNIQLSVMLDK